MIKTNIKIAWRALMHDRLYSIINVIGLAGGIAFALIIGAYIWTELQVNASLSNSSSQYIIQSRWKNPNEGLELTTIGPLAKSLREEYPSLVKNFYRWDGITSAISKGDKSFREGIQVGDSTILQMYGFHLIHGDPATAFEGLFSVVLTREKAIKFFGKDDVVGETISMESFSGTKHDFVIKGVMEKPAKNSVTFLTPENDNGFYIPSSNAAYFGRNIETWFNPYVVSYVQLQKGVDPTSLAQPMRDLLKRNADAKTASSLHPYLVPLKEYYLSANNGLIRKLLYSLSAIAIFILGMAIINFINLSISRASRRLREIGIRKVLGGLRGQLIAQFLVESTLTVLIATVFGLCIYAATSGFFSALLGEEVPGIGAFVLQFWTYLLLLIFGIGLAAGLYPAFVLSSLKSSESLKGKLSTVAENVWLRKSLVGLQFFIATIILVCSIVFSQQIQLFFSKQLGYNKDFLISVAVPRDWTPAGVKKMEAIRDQLAQLPQVQNISLSYEVPAGNSSGVFAVHKMGADPSTAIQTQSIFTDEHYLDTYGIPLLAGEFYGPPNTNYDSLKLVVNEKMTKALGFKNPYDALGTQVKNQGGTRVFTIAGVTGDFHFSSMEEEIQPLTFFQLRAFNPFRVFSIKLKGGNVVQSMDAIRKKWMQVLPSAPFEYTFMDDTLAGLYKTEIQLKKASYCGTILSSIIVLLGILGLVSQSVQKRTKEIGIRKVLGSSVRNILALFMREVIWTIVIAGLIACPIAYLLLSKWLQGYAYRIPVTALPFVVSIGILISLTAILVAAQTIRTALANPVKSLRTE